MAAFDRRGRALVVLSCAAALGLLLWQYWPSDTRRIRRKLDALASVVNERPQDGLGQVARTAQLARFLADDVVLEPGRGAGAIHGRERLLALASRAPNEGHAYKLEFVDVSVALDEAQEATAHLTATLTMRDADTREPRVDAREIELRFRRTDDWRITRIALVDTLEKPVP